MNALSLSAQAAPVAPDSLPALVDRASQALASARTSAEVLDARDMASVAYDAAKRAARLSKAKGAHDDLIAKAHRAQADALEIQAVAKRRLADEYDAAQERGEVATGREGSAGRFSGERPASASDIGLSRKEVHEARMIRDAERADPGIVRRTLDARLDSGQEPTKAAMREAVIAASERGNRPERRCKPSNPYKQPPNMVMRASLDVADACVEIVGREKPRDPSSIFEGAHSQAERGLWVSRARDAHAFLTRALEIEDAR